MKSLLFDLSSTQPNNESKRHGGGKYGEIVFSRLAERDIKFSCFYDGTRWLNPEIEAICRDKDIPLYDIQNCTICDIINQRGIERVYTALVAKWVLDVPQKCELFATLHGLRDLEKPNDIFFLKYKNTFREKVKFFAGKFLPKTWQNFIRHKYKRIYFDSGMRFVTVSEHTRWAIKSWFPEYNVEIKCFYSPNTSGGGGKNSVDRRGEGTEQYLLLVSGNRWIKNNLRAIMAFDRLVTNKQVDGSLRMKVTGCRKENFNYKIRNEERFDFLGYVDEDELDRLYAGAYLFVYPSLNEGFGYPPLEAMRYKVPVIASPFSSMAEVLDGGAMFFNPFSVEEIMNRMLMMMKPETHERFAERGYEQYNRIRERQDRDLDALIDYLIADSPS